MNSKVIMKDKLILLVILAITAGFLFQLPQDNTKQKGLNGYSLKEEKNDKNAINCASDIKSDLSLITENSKNRVAPNECLFLGCSGFSY